MTIKKNGEENHEYYLHCLEMQHVFYSAIPRCDAILEIGCGLSELSQSLIRSGYSNVTAIDWSLPAITFAEQQADELQGVQYACMDARDMKTFRRGTFQAVISAATLDCTATYDNEDVERILSEIHRVLSPGGVLLLVSSRLPHSNSYAATGVPGPCWWETSPILVSQFRLCEMQKVGRHVGKVHAHQQEFISLCYRKHETYAHRDLRINREEKMEDVFAQRLHFFQDDQMDKHQRAMELDTRQRETRGMREVDMESTFYNKEEEYLVAKTLRGHLISEWYRVDVECNCMKQEDIAGRVMMLDRQELHFCIQQAIVHLLHNTFNEVDTKIHEEIQMLLSQHMHDQNSCVEYGIEVLLDSISTTLLQSQLDVETAIEYLVTSVVHEAKKKHHDPMPLKKPHPSSQVNGKNNAAITPTTNGILNPKEQGSQVKIVEDLKINQLEIPVEEWIQKIVDEIVLDVCIVAHDYDLVQQTVHHMLDLLERKHIDKSE